MIHENYTSLSGLVSKSGLSINRVVHELGISYKTWDAWLSGRAEPSLDQRDRLAQMLGCAVEDINEAVANNRERWLRCQQTLVVPAFDPGDKPKSAFPTVAEILVQVIVSVVTSVLVTLKLLGKL